MKQRFVVSMAIVILAGWACAKQGGASAPAKAGTAQAASKDAAKPAATPQPAAIPVTKEGVTILKAAACSSVENREPVGESAKFKANVGRVYLFTLAGTAADQETSIQHVWNHNGKKMGTVTLPVKGAHWRTYSSKLIDPSWTGEWKVDVSTASGDVIQSVAFRVE